VTKEKENLIAVWDGIFQGTKFLTPKEYGAREELIRETRKKVWHFVAWFIVILAIICALPFILLILFS